MKSGITANQLWTQQPVASRLVEVSDKTGFSLTAGSYVVRASSSQRATASFASTGTSVDITISSVTTTRATALFGGWTGDTNNAARTGNFVYAQLTAATVVTCTRGSGSDVDTVAIVGVGATEVQEFF